jgi:hypothetical protein
MVRYGCEKCARVRLQSGESQVIQLGQLEDFVSEARNPQNQKAVTAVEVFFDSPLLASGMCLVDTPGLGSIFQANTEATRSFIPHIDAAMIVIGIDPPLSADELWLAESVSAHVNDLIFVLNKADRAGDAERQAAANFAQRALESRLGRPIDRVYELSATEWLGAGPTRDAKELTERLQHLAAKSGAALAQAARKRGAERISRELSAIIAGRRGALLRPLEESRARIIDLRKHVGESETSLRDLTPLLMAEERQMSQKLDSRWDAFLQAKAPKAIDRLLKEIEFVPLYFGPKYRRELMRIAQAIAREMLLPWFQQEQQYAGELYRNGIARFVALADKHVSELSQALHVAELSAVLNSLTVGQELSQETGFHFHEMIRLAQPVSPFGFLRDCALGFLRWRQPFKNDAAEFVRELLVVNSSRAANDFKERVATSRHELEVKIGELLRRSLQQAEKALSAAEGLMLSGEVPVKAELARLTQLEGALGQGEALIDG